MPQWLTALTAFAEDPGSVPSIDIRWLRTTCNFSFRRSGVLF